MLVLSGAFGVISAFLLLCRVMAGHLHLRLYGICYRNCVYSQLPVLSETWRALPLSS